MARTALTDPDVIAAERERDRVALLHDDGRATDAALEAAERDVTRARADAERRRERPAAVKRERAALEHAEAQKRARWKANRKAVEKILVDRYVSARRLDDALEELAEAAAEYEALPALTPLLADAPNPLWSKRREPTEALLFVARYRLRHIGAKIGQGPAPLPPPPFRTSLTDVWEAFGAPIADALYDEPKAS
jgi:hypothetical protein